jgi:hypothetical protein
MSVRNLFKKKIVTTNGYTRSDTGKEVHAYIRAHPKNKGIGRFITDKFLKEIKRK